MRPDARLNICVGGFFIVELGAGQNGHFSGFLDYPLFLVLSGGYAKYNIAKNWFIASMDLGPV